MPRISCLIPLHRSRRFLPLIVENIDAHLSLGAEVVVSDRHLLDDTTDDLRVRYAGVDAVRVLTATDGVDWVANINALLVAATGDFLRIVPHDDTASADSTARLVAALEAAPDAVLATGIVRAFDLEGSRLPDRDELNVDESPDATSWGPEDPLTLAFCHRFRGGFKGVVRAAPVRAAALTIRPTPTLVASERLWLFGLALAGRFVFVPESVLMKRYYAESTHRSWTVTGRTMLDNAAVMTAYVEALVAEPRLRRALVFNVVVNAHRAARWFDDPRGPQPAYVPLAETDRLLGLPTPGPA